MRCIATVLCLAVFGLASCGGGGGGDGKPGDPAILQGTVAAEKAVVGGELRLSCASGELAAATGPDGRYQVDISNARLPCMLTVTGGKVGNADSPWTLSSAATKAGVANVTLWTHFVVARTLGADPQTYGTTVLPPAQLSKLTETNLSDAKAIVSDQLARLLGAAPSSDLDPMTTVFEAVSTNGMQALNIQLVDGLRWTGKTLSQATLEIVTGQLLVNEVPGTCGPGVLTGFTGDFNDVPIQVPYDPNNNSQGDGSIGGTAGTGGGPGAGGATGLGQFLNAMVRVERVDGSLLGEAVTDANRGLVTIIPCRYQGPLRLTVKGKLDGTTQFYEESTREYAPFPAGTELHSVVATLAKNVGITILTEAAWRYLGAKYGPDGWKSAAHINEANEAVRNEFNRFLPVELQISDITRMPVLLNSATASGSVDVSPNGKYGIVSAGLARAAGLLRTGDASAALKIAQQMGEDLCDGVLDYTCNGKPVVANSADAAYLIPQLGEFLNAGIGDIATSCGKAEVEMSSFRIVQVKLDSTFLSNGPAYQNVNNPPIFLLRNDGKVFFWAARDRAPEPYAPALTFRQLFSQGPLLGTTLDGRVFRAPLTLLGPSAYDATPMALAPVEAPAYQGASTLAEIDKTFSSDFAQIVRLADGRAYVETVSGGPSNSGLGNVVGVSVARGGSGSPGFFAVTTDGAVFAWGNNSGGQLGLGKSQAELVEQASPALVRFPQPAFLVSAAGRMFGAFAIDRAGEVWGWGDGALVNTGLGLSLGSSPQQLQAFDAFKPIRQIECAAFSQCAALSSNGEMLVWGFFEGTSSKDPVAKVPLPAGRKAVYIGAAGLTVYGLLDDGSVILFPDKGTSGSSIAPSTTPYLVKPNFLPAGTGASCTGPR